PRVSPRPRTGRCWKGRQPWRGRASISPTLVRCTTIWSAHGRSRRTVLVGPGPLQQRFDGPAVHDPVDGHFTLDRPCAPVPLPVQLAGGVSVGVDGEVAIPLDRQVEEPAGWVEPFGPAVDLHGGAGVGAGR